MTQITENIIGASAEGIFFIPSGSNINPKLPNAEPQITAFSASTAASGLIPTASLNAYFQIPLLSGSNQVSGEDLIEIIRYHTSSINLNQEPTTVNPTLYFTSSNGRARYRNVSLESTDNAATVVSKTYNTITGSIFNLKSYSASLDGNFIIINHLKSGSLPTPVFFTSSVAENTIGFNIVVTGSGTLNFNPPNIVANESASFQMKPDSDDNNSFLFSAGSASLGYDASSRTNSTLIYFSSSGDVGIGTKNPKGRFEVSGSIKGEEITTKPTTGRPIKIKDSEIKFYETTQQDPKHSDYDDNKERARIKAVPGSFNLVFEVSGSDGYTNSVYISQSGRIGFNTDDPQSEFDAIVNEAQFQRPGARKGLKINQDGNIESFNKEAASAATGSEFVLRYSRGSVVNEVMMEEVTGLSFADDAAAQAYFNALPSKDQSVILEKAEAAGFNNLPQVGDTIGSIRFIAESGSTSAGEGFDDRVTGEAAAITAKVHSVDETGVRGDLIFKVADQTGAAVQRMVLDSGDNHQITGSLTIGGSSTTSGDITLEGPTGNSMGGIFRYGANSADQKIGRLLLHDDGTQKIQLSAKGKSFITATSDGVSSDTRLGIGTTTPGDDYMLDVTGVVNLRDNLIVTGSATFGTGTVVINGTAGHITASGNISASGNILGNVGQFNKIEIDGEAALDTADSATTGRVFADSNIAKIEIGKAGSTAITVIEGNITASGNISSSGTITANSFVGTFTGAVTGDATGLTGTPDITVGNITATGTVTAQEFHTEFVSASILFESGSTKFGDTLDDVHNMTGSLNVTGSINVSDNTKINIGDSDDLEIYHDGSHSYITDVGSGVLKIGGNQVHIGNPTVGEVYFKGYQDAQVELYHNNSKKLETTTGGIDITGNITASGNISSSGTGENFFNGDFRFDGDTTITTVGASDDISINPAAELNLGTSNADVVQIGRQSGAVPIKIFAGSSTPTFEVKSGHITASGNISASGEGYFSTVGIGIDSPSHTLEVRGPESTLARFYDSSNGSIGQIEIGTMDIKVDSDTMQFRDSSNNSLVTINTGGHLTASGNISASGTVIADKIGIGTSDPISKMELQDGTFTVDNGNITVLAGGISVTRNSAGNTGLTVNQQGTADILNLQDDGTEVFTVIDGGNVGIGASAPTEKLQVEGNISASGDLYAQGGQVFLGGTTYAFEQVGGNYGIRNSSGNYGGNDGSGAYATPQEFLHIPGNVRFGPKYATTDRDYIKITPSGEISTISTANEHFVIDNEKETASSTAIRAGNTELHISSSGIISASGGIIAPSFTGSFSGDATGLTGTPDISVRHITASGNISASGNIIGELTGIGGAVTGISSILNTGLQIGRDSSDKIGFDNDNQIDFRVGGGDRMVLSSTGLLVGGDSTTHITASGDISASGTIIADKIGVGTSNPTSTAGSDNFIQIYGAVDSGLGIKSNNADWEFKNENPTGNLSLFSAGSSRVTFTEVGNVGIGTNAPVEKLHVVGNISSSGKITVGADGNGSDFKVFGEKANTFMQYDASEEQLVIKHPKDQAGLTVFTTSSASPTGGGQIRVGRDGGQYIGLKTLDRDAHFIHRQDETDGGQARTYFEIWDSNHPVSGSHHWAFRSADGDGGNLETRMLISSSGNVGIGTTTPSQKLDVQGTILVNNEVQFVDSNMRIFRSSNDMRLRTGGSDRITISGSGNVGIGTTTPAYPLSVEGDVDINGGELRIDQTNNIRFSGAQTLNANVSTGIVTIASHGSLTNTHINSNVTASGNISASGTIVGSNLSGTNTGDQSLDHLAITGSDVIFGNITASGNISASGDGTFNKLFVKDNYALEFQAESAGPRIFFGSTTDTNAYMSFGAFGGINNIDTKNRDFHLFGTNTTTGFYFDESAGKFGIGTTSPSEKLHIHQGNTLLSGSSSHEYKAFPTSNTYASSIKFDNNELAYVWGGGVKAYFGNSHQLSFGDRDPSNGGANKSVQDPIIGKTATTNNTGSFHIKTADISRLFISGSGNVGIGTTTPAEKLEVDGNIQADSYKISNATVLAGSTNVALGSSGATGTISLNTHGGTIFKIDGNDNILIRTGSASVVGGTARMTVDVGSGTSSPISIVNGTTDGMYIRRYGSSGKYQIQTNVGGGNSGVFSLQSYGGNVGIGTTAAPEKLTVEGNISASGDVIVNDVTASNMQVSNAIEFTNSGISALDLNNNNIIGVNQLRFNDPGNEEGLIWSNIKVFESPDDLSNSAGNLQIEHSDTVIQTVHDTGIEVNGNITASGDISASGEVMTDTIFRARGGVLRFRQSTNTWDAMSMSTGGKLELASGGTNDRGHLVLHADHGSSPQTGLIEFENEAQQSSYLFTDASQSLKFSTTDPGEDDSVGFVVGVPKVEYYTVTSSGLTTNTEMGLPNSLTYMTSSGGYEYLEVFTDGIRLNRTIDYTEVDTSTVRYLISIPSQSIITYKSLRTV